MDGPMPGCCLEPQPEPLEIVWQTPHMNGARGRESGFGRLFRVPLTDTLFRQCGRAFWVDKNWPSILASCSSPCCEIVHDEPSGRVNRPFPGFEIGRVGRRRGEPAGPRRTAYFMRQVIIQEQWR